MRIEKYSSYSDAFKLAQAPEGVPERFINTTTDSIFPCAWKAGVENYVKNFGTGSFTRGTGLYIHGPNKTGKTLALYAIFNTLKKRWPVALVKSSDLERAAKVTSGTIPFRSYGYDPDDVSDPSNIWTESDRFIDDLKNFKGVLLIDDLAAVKISEDIGGRFYEVIDARYEDNVPTIYTSNWSLKELEEFLSPRVCSRIDRTCAVINTQEPQ